MAFKKKKNVRKKKIPFKYRMKMRRWPAISWSAISKRPLVAVVILLFVIAAMVAIVYFALFGFGKSPSDSGGLVVFLPQLLTRGYSAVEIEVMSDENIGIVTLTAGCERLTAYVEPDQAESIYRGINKMFVDRPNAHDIAIDAFDNFGIEVIMVRINEVLDNAFHGNLILKKGNKIVNLDARPSDATAIAVRAGAPIYVKNELFETDGEKIC